MDIVELERMNMKLLKKHIKNVEKIIYISPRTCILTTKNDLELEHSRIEGTLFIVLRKDTLPSVVILILGNNEDNDAYFIRIYPDTELKLDEYLYMKNKDDQNYTVIWVAECWRYFILMKIFEKIKETKCSYALMKQYTISSFHRNLISCSDAVSVEKLLYASGDMPRPTNTDGVSVTVRQSSSSLTKHYAQAQSGPKTLSNINYRKFEVSPLENTKANDQSSKSVTEPKTPTSQTWDAFVRSKLSTTASDSDTNSKSISRMRSYITQVLENDEELVRALYYIMTCKNN